MIYFIIKWLYILSGVGAVLYLGPGVTALVISGGCVLLVNNHISLLLIQLEYITLFLLYTLLFETCLRIKTTSVFLFLCVIAGEAALELSLLIINRRAPGYKLEK